MKCDVCGASGTWTQPIEPGVPACGDCIAAFLDDAGAGDRSREDSGGRDDGGEL